MSFSNNFQIISLLQIFHGLIRPSVTLIAVNRSPTSFVHKFYQKEQNENPPLESDPTIIDTFAWLRICQRVSDTGVFEMFDYQSVDMRNMYRKQNWLSRGNSLYALQHFALVDYNQGSTFMDGFRLNNVGEYVFECPLKVKGIHWRNCFYVSKAYNIQHDLRFVFFRIRRHSRFAQLIYIEEAAEPYLRPDFNVELHYLELKKHHYTGILKFTSLRIEIPTGPDNEICYTLFVEHDIRDPQNTVLSAPHFKDVIKRPYEAVPIGCQKNKVSFKTTEGSEAAAGESYFELTLRCSAIALDEGDNRLFFISRAYNPNEVFVYTKRASRGKMYLEILSTNVGIIHEFYGFGNAET